MPNDIMSGLFLTGIVVFLGIVLPLILIKDNSRSRNVTKQIKLIPGKLARACREHRLGTRRGGIVSDYYRITKQKRILGRKQNV